MIGSAVGSPVRLARGGFDRSSENLWVEQRLSWQGKNPDEETWQSLPERLVDAHFEEVRRALGGILRCRRVGERTECSFPGGPSALVFEKDTVEVGDERILVSMRILGGVLARGAESYGALRMGVSRAGSGEVREISAWQEVDGYPSRFIRKSRLPGVRFALRVVSRIYREYHAVVTFRSLERVRSYIEARAVSH